MVEWDKCVPRLIFVEIWEKWVFLLLRLGYFFCDICPNLSFRNTIWFKDWLIGYSEENKFIIEDVKVGSYVEYFTAT